LRRSRIVNIDVIGISIISEAVVVETAVTISVSVETVIMDDITDVAVAVWVDLPATETITVFVLINH